MSGSCTEALQGLLSVRSPLKLDLQCIHSHTFYKLLSDCFTVAKTVCTISSAAIFSLVKYKNVRRIITDRKILAVKQSLDAIIGSNLFLHFQFPSLYTFRFALEWGVCRCSWDTLLRRRSSTVQIFPLTLEGPCSSPIKAPTLNSSNLPKIS